VKSFRGEAIGYARFEGMQDNLNWQIWICVVFIIKDLEKAEGNIIWYMPFSRSPLWWDFRVHVSVKCRPCELFFPPKEGFWGRWGKGKTYTSSASAVTNAVCVQNHPKEMQLARNVNRTQ
jgi:hypothetical protein